MDQATVAAIAALILGALAVLPGSLGIVTFTHKLAATAGGARLIYNRSRWVLLVSALVMCAGLVSAIQRQSLSLVLLAVVAVYAGILVFGFLMHVSLNFKPVREPLFIDIDQAMERFGEDEEVVGVIDASGSPFAFVTRLARRPHVVYQPSGAEPFIMSHCILAHSSMAYATRDRFAEPDLQVVAVIANNMVFYDKSSRCAVVQIENRSRQGELALEMLPTVSVSLKTWHALYPESPVWIRQKTWRDTFYLKLLSRADVIDASSAAMIYPTQHPIDNRLPMKSQVVGIEVDGDARAYPLEAFVETPVINDRLGGRSLLIASACERDFIQVFDREIESGQVLEFAALDGSDGFADTRTGSVWAPTGECLSGELAGRRLSAVSHYNKIFWYVWADFHKGMSIYGVT